MGNIGSHLNFTSGSAGTSKPATNQLFIAGTEITELGEAPCRWMV
jgi:hypothetical protein